MSMITPSWEHYGTHDDSAYPELWEGCVGAWCPGLGPSGYGVVDHSGSGKHGTLTNTTPAAAWKMNNGWALDFDKTTSPPNHVQIGDAPYDIRTVATAPFTLACWFYVKSWTGDADEFMPIVAIGLNDKASATLAVYRKKLTLYADTTGDGSWDIGLGTTLHNLVLSLGLWYHGAITRDTSGRYVAYVNGSPGDVYTNTSNLVLTSQNMKIGAHYALNETYDADGYIDDVLFYGRCLSQPVISLLSSHRAIAYSPRRPSRFYSFADVSNRRRRFFLGAAA